MPQAASLAPLAGLPAFFLATTPDGQVLYVGRALLDALGMAASPDPRLAMLPGSRLQSSIQGCFAELAKQELPRIHDMVFEVPDGRQIRVRWQSHAVRGVDGELMHIESLGYDLSRSEGGEGYTSGCRIRACERSVPWAQVLEQIVDHVAIITPDGNIEYVNAAFEAVSGQSRESILGHPIREVWGELGSTEGLPPTATLCTVGGEAYHCDRVSRSQSGELFFDEVVVSPLRDQQGRIEHFVAVGRDGTAKHLTDPLTGLMTHHLLQERIRLATERSQRDPARHPALLFLDVDRFKSINDTYGQQAGDQVIRELGRRIQLAVRELDAVAQVGHMTRDEYAVLLEDLRTPDDARRIAQRISDRMRGPIPLVGGEVVPTASIGITYDWKASTRPEEVIRDAETAMMRAKHSVPGSHAFFDPVLHQQIVERQRLNVELQRALERDELILHYQPVVDLTTGRVSGAEALVRWQHPERGLLPPAQFIPAAEQSDLIVTLGLHVLRSACHQMATWHRAGFDLPSVSVNVSARQLGDPHLVDLVRAALLESSLEQGAIKLEVTESMAVTDPEATLQILAMLKGLGVRILLDDFGTGYSSLSYLTRLPLDMLKIDRSFICQVPGNAHDESVVTTICAMAKSLGLGLVAEGVETEEQLRFVRGLRCDEMQGFVFSRPLPAAEFRQFVQEGQGAPWAPN